MIEFSTGSLLLQVKTNADALNQQLFSEKLYTRVLPISEADDPILSLEIALAIQQFWNDPIIPNIMDQLGGDCYLTDSAS